MDQSLTQNVDTLFSNMETFAQQEGMIGKPVTQGDKTFLPVVSVTLGYGGGDTKGKTPQSGNMAGGSTTTASTGGALGLGAKLSTEAVIIIDKGNVSLVPLTGVANMSSQVIDKIPEIMQNLTSGQNASK